MEITVFELQKSFLFGLWSDGKIDLRWGYLKAHNFAVFFNFNRQYSLQINFRENSGYNKKWFWRTNGVQRTIYCPINLEKSVIEASSGSRRRFGPKQTQMTPNDHWWPRMITCTLVLYHFIKIQNYEKLLFIYWRKTFHAPTRNLAISTMLAVVLSPSSENRNYFLSFCDPLP